MNEPETWRERARELAAAFVLLTRLPAGRFAQLAETKPAVWAYPIVGAVVGLIGGLAYWLTAGLSCPPALAALLAVGALILVTGALHEDGLADAADGLGGDSPQTRLAIMRDARIGTFGVLALILSVGLRAGAIALIAGPGFVSAALIATGASSRSTAAALMAALPHAREDGLSIAAGRPTGAAAAVAVAIGVLIALLLLPIAAVFWLLVASGFAGLVVAHVARTRLGGQTGDVLGACVQVSECGGLIVLAGFAS